MKRIVFINLFILLSFTVFSQSKKELEEKQEKNKQEISMTTELLQKTSKEKEASVQQLNLLTKSIVVRNQMISDYESQIRLIDFAIGQTNTEISDLERKIEKEREEYVRLIYSAYVSQTKDDRFMYVIASESFSQAYQRIKYLKYLSEYRMNRIEEIKNSVVELESKRTDLLDQKKDKERVLTEKAIENRNLQRQKSEKDLLVSKLKAQESKLREELKKKEAIQNQIELEIRKLIEEEARRSRSENLYTSLTPEQKLVSSEFKSNKGRLPWPVERGVITAGYGKVRHPVLQDVWISNSGIDITSNKGSLARAVFDGEVSRVVAILGANYTVIIRHGEYLTVYQNLVNVRVKSGDKVKTKQVIGEIFTGQDGTNSVLHYEVWREKTILNPEEWISK